MEPRLDAIGIVTADMAASCRFYRLLGVPVGEPPEGEDHFEATLPSGIRLMWDSRRADEATQPGLAAARRPPSRPCLPLRRRGRRGRTHAAVVAAGFGSKNDPWDAFWGQRYALVLDPDDNVVDLFAPLGD